MGRAVTGLLYSLFLGGRKEAHHLHGLLQALKVVPKVVCILYGKVLLLEMRKRNTAGSGLTVVKIHSDILHIKNRIRTTRLILGKVGQSGRTVTGDFFPFEF